MPLLAEASRSRHGRELDWTTVAQSVLRSRELDLFEEAELAPSGRILYQFSARGHELAQVLLALQLDHAFDAAAGYYRSRPFALAAGLTLVEAIAGGMALTGSPSEGRDVGVIFNMPRRTGPTLLPMAGDVGAQFTAPAGWAHAIRYRSRELGEREWDGALAVAMGGDAAVATNGFWSALNLVTTARLPYLFFIEDNGYGVSVPAGYQVPGGNIAANLAAYRNLLVLDGDGADPDQAWRLIAQAVAHVRAGAGPCLLHLSVPRLCGHTFTDDEVYRSREDRRRAAARDPVPRLRDWLAQTGRLAPDRWDELRHQARVEVRLAAAEAAGHPAPDSDAQAVHRHLFSAAATGQVAGGPRLYDHSRESGSPRNRGPRINLRDAIRRTLEAEMAADPRILVFGEDVGAKGGVHACTLGLQRRFGEARVFDTSLSEEGILGRAQGLALAGLLPVPEIQFRKFADAAAEQLANVGTLRWRTAGRFAAPMVVRIPVGISKAIGDLWHAASGEATFTHMLGWRIACPSNAADAAGLLRTSLRGGDPVLFLEPRSLLDAAAARRPYPGDDYCVPFGQAANLLEGDRLTVVSWGTLLPRCVEAAADFPGRVTVLDLRTLCPWDQEAVLQSVRGTGKLLVVHEDTRTGGFAAEIIATVASACFPWLDGPPERLTTPDVPIPFHPDLMNASVPGVARIRAEIQKLLRY